MGRHLNPRPFEGYAVHLILASKGKAFLQIYKKTRKANISLSLDFKIARALEPILTLGQNVISTAD
jgi:hypothetical protein